MVLLTSDLRARTRKASRDRAESQSQIIRKALEGHLTRLGYPKNSGWEPHHIEPNEPDPSGEVIP